MWPSVAVLVPLEVAVAVVTTQQTGCTRAGRYEAFHKPAIKVKDPMQPSSMFISRVERQIASLEVESDARGFAVSPTKWSDAVALPHVGPTFSRSPRFSGALTDR